MQKQFQMTVKRLRPSQDSLTKARDEKGAKRNRVCPF